MRRAIEPEPLEEVRLKVLFMDETTFDAVNRLINEPLNERHRPGGCGLLG